jgi:hypothetical protein
MIEVSKIMQDIWNMYWLLATVLTCYVVLINYSWQTHTYERKTYMVQY